MRRKAKMVTQQSSHDSIPNMAFELAMWRMRYTQENTQDIINDYLRELAA